MARILDLDTLPTRDEVTIVLDGEKHVMRPVTVGRFIEQQKVAKQVDASGDIGASLDAVVSLIADSFPSLTRDKLLGLPMSALAQILAFIVDKAEEAQAEGNAPGAVK